MARVQLERSMVAACLGVSLVATSVPASAADDDHEARASPPEPTPDPAPDPTPAPPSVPYTMPGEIVRSPNPSILTLSLVLFGATYASSAIAGAISTKDADRYLLVPFAGPWIDIVDRGCKGDACGSTEEVARSFVVASAIVQAFSVGLAVTAFLLPERIETRIVVKPSASAVTAPKPATRIVPLPFGAGAGLGAFGTF